MSSGYIDRLSRTDRDVILTLVPPHVKVLDLGCGDGSLLGELVLKKQVHGMGVDIDGEQLIHGLAQGLNVYQGDMDAGLADFPDQSFDYVILNQTLQVVRNPMLALTEALRIGRYVIVGFPNFGQWRLRCGLFFGGRAPKSPALPFEWYDTPNIRVLTVRDFIDYCHRDTIKVAASRYLIGHRWVPGLPCLPLINLLTHIAIFVISRR